MIHKHFIIRIDSQKEPEGVSTIGIELALKMFQF